MKISQIQETLEAKILAGKDKKDVEVDGACGSDLMSDVMAYAHDHNVLLTGLMNPQVVRTAELMDIRAIVFVRGKLPESSIIELAEEKQIIILSTELPMYIACGKLYSAGLPGKCDI